jgi:hypothetical protein
MVLAASSGSFSLFFCSSAAFSNAWPASRSASRLSASLFSSGFHYAHPVFAFGMRLPPECTYRQHSQACLTGLQRAKTLRRRRRRVYLPVHRQAGPWRGGGERGYTFCSRARGSCAMIAAVLCKPRVTGKYGASEGVYSMECLLDERSRLSHIFKVASACGSDDAKPPRQLPGRSQ